MVIKTYTHSNSPPKIKQIKHPHSVWDHITRWCWFWCYLTLSAGQLSLWSSLKCSVGWLTQCHNICSFPASLMDEWHWARDLGRYALAKISGKNQLCINLKRQSWSVFCFCCDFFLFCFCFRVFLTWEGNIIFNHFEKEILFLNIIFNQKGF